MEIDSTFWKDKKVLVTGHTGFKGTWLTYWLTQMGAQVKGISLAPNTDPSMYELVIDKHNIESSIGDIRNLGFLKKQMASFEPDIIMHLAAQALVRESYKNPVDTIQTNVVGTANVLEAAKSSTTVRAILCITSDKCYENNEWPWRYREVDCMGGHDPYSASKGCAELVVSSFRRSFFDPAKYSQHGVAVASARAGNVIGGGDWSSDRLLPDIIRSFSKGKPVVIRNPAAIRPWQFVLDVLRGYLLLTQKLFKEGAKFASAWNFGPPVKSEKNVQYIVERMSSYWGENAHWKQDEAENPHEAFTLKLDSSKARNLLNWEPILSLDEGLKFSVDWYKKYYKHKEATVKITAAQLHSFCEMCKPVALSPPSVLK